MHRTTFRIDEEILAEAKALAARQHRSLNSVMEEALRRMIRTTEEIQERPRVTLPESGTPGGPHLTPDQIKEILLEQEIGHFLEVTADAAHGHKHPDLREQA